MSHETSTVIQDTVTEIVRANRRMSYSATVPHLQIAWDSVSMGAFKKCPRYYQLTVVDGWQPKRGNASLHLRYGILYHRVGEVYDHHRAAGDDHETALRAALWDMAEGCTDTADDGTRSWWNPSEGLSEEKAEANVKTIPNLFRTAVDYLDRFEHDHAKTVILENGKPAVELSFRFNIGYTFSSGEEMMWSGHMDKLVDFNGGRYVLDKKTTKNTISGNSARQYFSQFSPNNQMSGYTLAGRIVSGTGINGIIIDAAQIAKGFSRFERGIVHRTEDQLAEWINDLHIYAAQADEMARKGYWPMNDTACTHYGGCPMQDICSKDPSVREVFLRGGFEKREWDPFETRGDI